MLGGAGVRRVRLGVRGSSRCWGEAGRARGRGLTWPPRGLGTSRLPISPSVPCFFRLSTSSGTKSLFLFYMNVQQGGHKMGYVCVGGDIWGVAINLKFYFSSVVLADLDFFCRF